MPVFVRIKDPGTGHESTVSADLAEANGLPIIDKPATDAAGWPLAAKISLTPKNSKESA